MHGCHKAEPNQKLESVYTATKTVNSHVSLLLVSGKTKKLFKPEKLPSYRNRCPRRFIFQASKGFDQTVCIYYIFKLIVNDCSSICHDHYYHIVSGLEP